MRVQSLAQKDPLEEGMATHSRILAWRIPWREEPGGLQSMGSQRVRHNWSNLACLHVTLSICLQCHFTRIMLCHFIISVSILWVKISFHTFLICFIIQCRYCSCFNGKHLKKDERLEIFRSKSCFTQKLGLINQGNSNSLSHKEVLEN